MGVAYYYQKHQRGHEARKRTVVSPEFTISSLLIQTGVVGFSTPGSDTFVSSAMQSIFISPFGKYLYLHSQNRRAIRGGVVLSDPETRAFTHSKKATVDRCENVVSPLCGACSFIDEDTGLARYS